tara:strand:+ start:3347 stop:3925 length:579 start_codon:yes stop_codon:yes gene_type:complete
MSDDGTTSLDALPMESAGGAQNVKFEVKEKERQEILPTTNNLSSEAVSNFMSDLQAAAAAGATDLPSRDIPMDTQQITQDEQVKPNYIPPPKNEKYIENDMDFQSLIQQASENKKEKDSMENVYDEIQTPLFIMVLFFMFNMPFMQKQLLHLMPSFFRNDGHPKLSGYIIKTLMFGCTYYGLSKISNYVSEL